VTIDDSTVAVSIAEMPEIKTAAERIDTPIGGGYFFRSGENSCTTGFAIKNAQGNPRMLTAAHCVAKVGSPVTTHNDEAYGQVHGPEARAGRGHVRQSRERHQCPYSSPHSRRLVQRQPQHSQSGERRTEIRYFGHAAVHRRSLQRRTLHGKTKAFLGDVSVPVVGNVESMLLVSSAPQDQSNFSNVLAGAGDSGGPGFFQYTGSNGVDYINPIGILSATYGGRPGICAGENARRKCSSEVLTVPIYDVLKALNATLYIY
jgi:hypothetical protein